MKPKGPRRVEAFARVLLLSKKRPEQYALLERIGELAGRRPQQWAKLKEFLRTGRRPRYLRLQTVKDFSGPLLDYADAVNIDREKPYTGVFSARERGEVRRQVRDLVRMMMPRASKEHRGRMINSFLRKMTPVQRRHVEGAIKEGDFGEIFDRGRMYLDSLGRGNIKKAEGRGLKLGHLGAWDTEFLMRDGWMGRRYDRTTPFHEAAHFITGMGERNAHMVEYYYSLKRGIMDPRHLKRMYPMDREEGNARRTAIRLYAMGRRQGWGRAEAELRRQVYGRMKRRH